MCRSRTHQSHQSFDRNASFDSEKAMYHKTGTATADEQHEHQSVSYLAITVRNFEEDMSPLSKLMKKEAFIRDLIINAETFYREGEFKNAFALFLKAESLYRQTHLDSVPLVVESDASTNTSWDPPSRSSVFQRQGILDVGIDVFMDIENVDFNSVPCAITATLLYNAGQAKLRMNDYRDAFSCFKRAHQTLESTEIATHQIMIPILHSIGRIRFLRQYDLPRAIDAYNDALKCCVILYGRNHLHRADTLNCLGGIYSELSAEVRIWDEDTEKASLLLRKSFKYLQEALDIKLHILGSRHKDVAIILNSIGCVQFWQGDPKKALGFLEHAVDIRKSNPGTEVDYAMTLSNIAYIVMEGGECDRAFDMFQESLRIFRDKLPENHRDIMETIQFCGFACYKHGDYSDALELFEEAFRLAIEIFGSLHLDTSDLLTWIGATKNELGDFIGATEAYQSALDIYRKLCKPQHTLILRIFEFLGHIYYNRNEHDNAILYYGELLDLKKQRYDPAHVEIANTHHSIGVALKAKGALDKALLSFQDEIRIKREGPCTATDEVSELDMAKLLTEIGSIYLSRRDKVLMMEYLIKAARIYNKIGLCPIDNIVMDDLALYAYDLSCPLDAPAA